MLKKHAILSFITLFCLFIIICLAAVLFGSVAVNANDIFSALFKKEADPTVYTLLTTVRLPRVFGGILAGIGLSLSGVILQNVMNNSLASPSTIGVNAGAGFAAMLAMLFFPANFYMQAPFAFMGAFMTALIIFFLAYLGDNSRMTIILAGITVSSFLNAGMNCMKLLHSDLSVNLSSFLMGSLSGLTLNRLALPGIIIGLVFCVVMAFGRALNILALGDDIARSLGLSVHLIRFLLLLLASLLAGSVVSFAGLLSFVGLIVPHISRKLFGNDARILTAASALLGAAMVVFADLLGRMLAAPFEIPAGILMSFIGGPFFLYLLLKKKGERRLNA